MAPGHLVLKVASVVRLKGLINCIVTDIPHIISLGAGVQSITFMTWSKFLWDVAAGVIGGMIGSAITLWLYYRRK